MEWKSWHTALVLGLTLTFVAHGIEAKEAREVRVDAAFSYKKLHFLVKGDDLLVMKDNHEISVDRFSKMFRHVPFPVQGALLMHAVGVKVWTIHVFGSKGFLSFSKNDIKGRRSDYSDIHPFKNGGPDAVGKVNDREFLMKGCDIVEYRGLGKAWGKVKNLPELGLPCDVDAAWSHFEDSNKMVLLKGDQVWIWSKDEVTGPLPFHDVFNVKSWKLLPAAEEDEEEE